MKLFTTKTDSIASAAAEILTEVKSNTADLQEVELGEEMKVVHLPSGTKVQEVVKKKHGFEVKNRKSSVTRTSGNYEHVGAIHGNENFHVIKVGDKHYTTHKDNVKHVSSESFDESVELEEAYQTKHPETKKAWNHLVNTGLDADELEDLLFTMGSYYVEAGSDSDDGDFVRLGKALTNAANVWKNRKGN